MARLARSVDHPSLSTAMHAAGALRDAMVGKQYAGRDNQTPAAKSSTPLLSPPIQSEPKCYNAANNGNVCLTRCPPRRRHAYGSLTFCITWHPMTWQTMFIMP